MKKSFLSIAEKMIKEDKEILDLLAREGIARQKIIARK